MLSARGIPRKLSRLGATIASGTKKHTANNSRLTIARAGLNERQSTTLGTKRKDEPDPKRSNGRSMLKLIFAKDTGCHLLGTTQH